jgi:hypothetical protein
MPSRSEPSVVSGTSPRQPDQQHVAEFIEKSVAGIATGMELARSAVNGRD